MTPLVRLLAAFVLLAGPALAARPPGEAAAPAMEARAAVTLAVALLPGRIEVALLDGRRPMSSRHAEGSAVLTVNGRDLGVALLPAGGNRLVGLAPFQPGDEVAAEIAVTVDGRLVKARYGTLSPPS